jgi:hypothetical protein
MGPCPKRRELKLVQALGHAFCERDELWSSRMPMKSEAEMCVLVKFRPAFGSSYSFGGCRKSRPPALRPRRSLWRPRVSNDNVSQKKTAGIENRDSGLAYLSHLKSWHDRKGFSVDGDGVHPHRMKTPHLAVHFAAIAPRDDARAVAVLDGVSRKHPHGCLIGSPPDDQVGRAGQDFVMAVDPHDFEGEVFWQHGIESLKRLTANRTKRE